MELGRRRVPEVLAIAVLAVAILGSGCAVPGAAHPEVVPTVGVGSMRPTSPPARRASNLPLRRLAPGERPPQFVLFSFDGVGASPNWGLFLRTAERSNARFTALMTGLYFLIDEARRHYRGPGHAAGEAAIGFGGTKAEVVQQIAQLNRTWFAGHELGTHFVGHFCRGDRYPGERWSAADWNRELDQFFALMQNWRQNTGIFAGEDLVFDTGVVRGGRTQCLEGSPNRLFLALREHCMTWDSSQPSRVRGLAWPQRTGGIWEFAIPYAYSPPLKRAQTALVYNFWFSVNGAKNVPSDANRLRRIVRETYRYMYDRAYAGNRAPLVIANHFNEWNGNAFNPATADFMADVCGRAATLCVTHTDLVAWLELQDPAVLAALARAPLAAVDERR
ncbi:polysaccharide deacetylase [Tsukamurella sp. DT100]|uniref:polysaccharide deacetylase n=1 Tax=Tsukamurella sp. DT100 TaxID=3393415 RepID=UPI003CFA0B18